MQSHRILPEHCSDPRQNMCNFFERLLRLEYTNVCTTETKKKSKNECNKKNKINIQIIMLQTFSFREDYSIQERFKWTLQNSGG